MSDDDVPIPKAKKPLILPNKKARKVKKVKKISAATT